MMKLIISILMCCALLVGCGDSKQNTTANDEESIITEKENNDLSFFTVKKMLELYKSSSENQKYDAYTKLKSAYKYLTYDEGENDINVFAKKINVLSRDDPDAKLPSFYLKLSKNRDFIFSMHICYDASEKDHKSDFVSRDIDLIDHSMSCEIEYNNILKNTNSKGKPDKGKKTYIIDEIESFSETFLNVVRWNKNGYVEWSKSKKEIEEMIEKERDSMLLICENTLKADDLTIKELAIGMLYVAQEQPLY